MSEEFEKELRDLINKHSVDAILNKNDFIIAKFLVDILKNLDVYAWSKR